jgi:hypothetical protein
MQHGLDDFHRLGFGEPAFVQEGLAILPVRATIRSRAALMPAMNGAGDESAKLVRAGAASWANRCAANLECRIVISSKFSTPHRLGFMQTARR